MKKSLRIPLIIILSIAIIIGSFTAGYFVHKNVVYDSSFKWAKDTIERYYYYSDGSYDYSSVALQGISDKYLDQYSEYYTADEYEALVKSNSGSKSGLGLSYMFVDGKGVYVSSVMGNSPAYMCGLRAGEWLKSGGKNGGNLTEFTTSADFSNLIMNASDSDSLTFKSEDREYTLSKSEYTASYAYMATNSSGWVFKDSADGGLAMYEDGGEKISYLPDGFAYIKLSQFFGTATSEFYKLVEKFNALNCSSLILDLRSNGGGYVSVMQGIAGCFSQGSSKVAMISRDKYGKEERFACEQPTASYRLSPDVNVYALANNGTASASEALLGAMICYGALEYSDIYLSDYSTEYLSLIGEQGKKNARTYGKGIMQTTYVNSKTNEALKLTTAKIYWPDGNTCIHDVGITKNNGCKTVATDWEFTKGDGELKKAVEMMTK